MFKLFLVSAENVKEITCQKSFNVLVWTLKIKCSSWEQCEGMWYQECNSLLMWTLIFNSSLTESQSRQCLWSSWSSLLSKIG